MVCLMLYLATKSTSNAFHSCYFGRACLEVSRISSVVVICCLPADEIWGRKSNHNLSKTGILYFFEVSGEIFLEPLSATSHAYTIMEFSCRNCPNFQVFTLISDGPTFTVCVKKKKYEKAEPLT